MSFLQRFVLILVAATSLWACGEGDPPQAVQEAEQKITGIVHESECNLVFGSIEENDGYDVPGDGGQPRLGMPESDPQPVRVRRSYSSLNSAEKRRLADAFLKLKQTPYSYSSICGEIGQATYTTNLYDYFVEAHASAFISMRTPYMEHTQMPHMGPQFPVWHRYYILRLETEMQKVLDDPGFSLPYWDWTDCGERSDDNPDANPCPKIFESDYLGSPGTCDDTSVSGYLTNSGFESQLFTTPGVNVFNSSGITCEPRGLQRETGCSNLAPVPPQASDISGIYDRTVYDVSPYDSCDTDQDVSFRQYLEGFMNTDTNLTCITGGCRMHGQGHLYISGDMAAGGTAPNDPMFFLHHANVDRMWAEWQAFNLENGRLDDHGNPGFPDDWRRGIFIWNEVQAEEMFDHRALGFTYDTLE